MIINIFVSFLIVSTVLFQTSCSNAIESPEAKLTLKVIGEDGKTIEGVDVGATFEISKGKGAGIKYSTEKGTTDKEGKYIVVGKTMFNVPYGAAKQGYYKSNGEYRSILNENGRWQPWNPEITIVLRKIENPVPMYARNTHMTLIILPETNKAIGFDLMEYDWVSPYGKGKHADFIFKYTGTYTKKDDFNKKLEVTFPNKFDGIQLVKENRKQGSMLKLPRQAPESGYNDRLIRSRSRTPGNPLKEDTAEDFNYIFRVRSEEKDGVLIRAMYGKIHGDILFDTDASNKATIIFKYYLNPDYTRNLEYNPQQNLFKNIPRGEVIGLD